MAHLQDNRCLYHEGSVIVRQPTATRIDEDNVVGTRAIDKVMDVARKEAHPGWR